MLWNREYDTSMKQREKADAALRALKTAEERVKELGSDEALLKLAECKREVRRAACGLDTRSGGAAARQRFLRSAPRIARRAARK